MRIIQGIRIKGIRHQSDGPFLYSLSTTIRQVPYLRQVPTVLYCFQKLSQRLFGAVSTDDKVDLPVVLEDFPVKIGSGKTSENDGDLRMDAFQKFRNLDDSLDVGKPVKVQTEQFRFEFPQARFRVKALLAQHFNCQVQDPHFEAEFVKVVGQGGKTDGIHFEDGRRRNNIRDGSVKGRPFTEVEHRGSVYQHKVRSHGISFPAGW
jgi:hypothetical protein